LKRRVRKLSKRTLQDILENNPFDEEGPSEYDIFLHAALELAYANIAGLTRAVEQLNQSISEHDRLHKAANVAAMELPEFSKDERPH
jgi:hypothetical protein